MYLLYYNFLHAVSLKYASTTFSVPTWWTGSKKSSQSYLHYYSTFSVQYRLPSWYINSSSSWQNETTFSPVLHQGPSIKDVKIERNGRGLKFGQNLQTDTVPNRKKILVQIFRKKITLVVDFQPGSLINLKKITSLLVYSVLLGQQFYQIDYF